MLHWLLALCLLAPFSGAGPAGAPAAPTCDEDAVAPHGVDLVVLARAATHAVGDDQHWVAEARALARTLVSLDARADALAVLEETALLARQQADEVVARDLARAALGFAEIGEAATARELVAEALAQIERDSAPVIALAAASRAVGALGDRRQARQLLARARASVVAPDEELLAQLELGQLAIGYAALGWHQTARAVLKRHALEIDWEAAGLLELATFYAERGDRARARGAVDRAAELIAALDTLEPRPCLAARWLEEEVQPQLELAAAYLAIGDVAAARRAVAAAGVEGPVAALLVHPGARPITAADRDALFEADDYGLAIELAVAAQLAAGRDAAALALAPDPDRALVLARIARRHLAAGTIPPAALIAAMDAL